MIPKSHDSSTHPVTRNSQMTLQLKLWALLVPFPLMPALKVPVLAHHRPPPVPATSALPKNSCLWPSSWVGCRIPGAVARPGLQILPRQCPVPGSGVLDTEPCPRGRGAQPQRPHRSPGPGGGRPVCARSPPPRCGASSSRAPVPAHLLPVGQAPRPGPAVSSHPPSPPRYPPGAPGLSPARAEVRLELPAPRSRIPRPYPLPLYPPGPALHWGLRCCPPPPNPCRARSGLAPRAWRATLERHEPRAPSARPRSSRCTARGAARPRRGEGVGGDASGLRG